MNTLIVYDSQYGNTEQIAQTIGTHLETLGAVRLVSVRGSADVDLTGVDLLVVGGPTHAHGASQLLRNWIDRVPHGALRGMAVATFDTRLRWPMFLSGSAAQRIAKILKQRGARVIAPPESFFVKGAEGPLVEGERERATAWANALGSALAAGAAATEPAQRAS